MLGNESSPGVTTRAIYSLFEHVQEAKFSEFLIRGS